MCQGLHVQVTGVLVTLSNFLARFYTAGGFMPK